MLEPDPNEKDNSQTTEDTISGLRDCCESADPDDDEDDEGIRKGFEGM